MTTAEMGVSKVTLLQACFWIVAVGFQAAKQQKKKRVAANSFWFSQPSFSPHCFGTDDWYVIFVSPQT